MPRKSGNAIQANANAPTAVDLDREEARVVIKNVIKRDGHPLDRLSRLAKTTQDEAIARAALSDLATYCAPRGRALEAEASEKPVAVNISFDLSAKDKVVG